MAFHGEIMTRSEKEWVLDLSCMWKAGGASATDDVFSFEE
jgi:hypothetical protein